MSCDLMKSVESSSLRTEHPCNFQVGDVIRVFESPGSRSFEGIVLRIRGSSTNTTFLVRKISFGAIGVERNFFYHSPLIEKIEMKVQNHVRRARIYYVRKLKGKAARMKRRKIDVSAQKEVK